MKWVNSEQARPIKSWCEPLEDSAREQAKNVANHPGTFRHVALMPDAHMGYGVPIGCVFASKDLIVPNAIGLDIGCGMIAVKTNILAKDVSKEQIKNIIDEVKKVIPVGFKWHKNPQESSLWNNIPINEVIEDNIEKAKLQLGTLGGGNHFCEIQEGNDDHLWLMIHSGSRNLGKQIGEHYHKKAVELCEKWHVSLPHKDLAFFPADSDIGVEYMTAMNFALEFAKENRNLMMRRFLFAVSRVLGSVKIKDKVNIHHNYASLENHFGQNVWVHRKGATSAKKGQFGIIPGSMGTPSYIVEGLENTESFMSCSHGAGRRMGRLQASRELTIEDANKAMGDIQFSGWGKNRKGETDLGEAPQAYKDIDEVIEAQNDLVKVLVKLWPVGVVKG
jgi:tRNA-splicing ligase RtcB